MTLPTSLFLYGTLRHVPLLETVLGRNPAVEPAALAGHAVLAVSGESYPTLVPREDAVAQGLLLTGVTAGDIARLDFYEGAYHYALRSTQVRAGAGETTVPAHAYFATGSQPAPAGPWALSDWIARHGDAAVLAAREAMALHGRMTPEEVRSRYGQMLVRAASAVRAAAEPAPATVRGHRRADNVTVIAERRPYTEFFAVAEQDLRFPKFDGGESETVRRAAFLTGDAVTVLPYDPAADSVLLIEQFRFGAHMRGDPLPWCLEPVAGRIDPGETPEEAVRREAQEEAGVDLGELFRVGAYYPSPGAVSEFLLSYVGLADLSRLGGGIGGAAAEAEDILSHVVGFDGLLGLLESGEAANGPLILSAQWIALNRERLRALA